MEQTQLELLAQNLRECLWEVLQETNEIPIYGKQTYWDGKETNGKVYELWRVRHILWPNGVKGKSQNPPTQRKTKSEGFWEVKKPCQWTRPEWRTGWNRYDKRTGRGGKGKWKPTWIRKLKEITNYLKTRSLWIVNSKRNAQSKNLHFGCRKILVYMPVLLVKVRTWLGKKTYRKGGWRD